MAKSPKFEILAIIDRSGSMRSMTDECVGAFNNFLAEQQAEAHRAKITLAIFDDQYEVLMDRVKLAEAQPITAEQIAARGSTALNDAIVKTINNARQDRPTICLIQTDGGENGSQEVRDASVVKDLIAEKQAEGWEFQFTGVGVDGFAIGSTYGLAQNQTATVGRSKSGFETATAVRSMATTNYAASLVADNS